MYNMIPYKSKVIHVEDGMINVFPIRNNRNVYPSKQNICGDDSSTVLINDEHLGDTIIATNSGISRKIIMESRQLVVSYLHIGLHTGDAKYRI